MNAFEYNFLHPTPIGEEPADATFVRALGTRAPALTHLRLLVRLRDLSYQPCTTICWSDLLAFVASCRRGVSHCRGRGAEYAHGTRSRQETSKESEPEQ
jgi:hypothetical protein